MALTTFSPPVKPTTSSDKPEFKILEAEFGDGYTQAVGDGMNNVRKVVTLSWDWLSAAQAQAIENFVYARRGAEPFLYTLSDSASALKWTCKEFTRKRGTPNTVEMTIRQSFALVS